MSSRAHNSRGLAFFNAGTDNPVMMKGMAITVTCSCGQQQFADDTLAGQTMPCLVCGQPLTIPRNAPRTAARKPTARPRESTPHLRWPIWLVAAALIPLVAFGTILVINATRSPPDEPIVEISNPAPIAKAVAPLPPPILQPRLGDPETKADAPDLAEPVKAKPEIPRPRVVPTLPRIEPVKPEALPPVEPKATPAIAQPLPLVWNLQEGMVFFQELTVTHRPTFKVNGLPVPSFLNYRIVSRFTVKRRDAADTWTVEQKIVTAQLLNADDLSKSTVEGAIAKLPGTVFHLHLNRKMEVTSFEGTANAWNVAGAGLGIQMASLIDRDGWRELAQATFFQFDQAPTPGLRWSKPMAHHWGSLGVWNGQTHYAYLGREPVAPAATEASLHKVGYALQLAYQAPKGGAIGLMTVQNAQFNPPQGSGFLLFDSRRGRVIAAEERFRVQGILTANILGQATRIEIDEDQHFAIRIHDKHP